MAMTLIIFTINNSVISIIIGVIFVEIMIISLAVVVITTTKTYHHIKKHDITFTKNITTSKILHHLHQKYYHIKNITSPSPKILPHQKYYITFTKNITTVNIIILTMAVITQISQIYVNIDISNVKFVCSISKKY